MNKDDFRYIRRGYQLQELKKTELKLLEAVDRREVKTGSALLILHGFSSSPAVYRYLIPKIKHYDAIVCPVLPGHSESVVAFANSTAEQWLEKATQCCAELVSQYKKVDVLGLSLGGVLALQLSLLFTLNHLYLLAPAIKLQQNTKVLMMLAQVLKFLGFQELRNAAGNILSTQNAEIAYRKVPLKAILEVLKFIQNYQKVTPTCPVDLFLGSEDQVVASKFVEEHFANLSNVTIHWLKNSAHVLPIDNDVQEIIDCINLTSKP